MRLIDQLINPPKTLGECHKIMKHAAHDNARLRSMLFQFLAGDTNPAFYAKVAEVLNVKTEVIPDRITSDKMFNSLSDED